MAKVFISYRRDDLPGYALLLKDRVESKFGIGSAFLDVSNSIQPGDDFTRLIKNAISDSDVVIALIGTNWLGAKGSGDLGRIHQSNDFIKLEISLALSMNKAIVPLVIEPAQMPSKDQLPSDLQELPLRQAIIANAASFESAWSALLTACNRHIERANHERALKAGDAESAVVATVLKGGEVPAEIAPAVVRLDFSQKREFLDPALCDGISVNLHLLKGCTNLEFIDISHSDNTSLSGLRDLKRLETIRIRRSKVVDISDVQHLSNLKTLYAFKSRNLSDMSPVARHPGLHSLVLGETAVSNLDAISSCSELRGLDLSHTEIESFEPLRQLDHLQRLWLNGTKFSRLSDIHSMRSLVSLDIAGAEVRSLDGIEKLGSLTELSVRYLKVKDLQPLRALTKLKKLWVDKNQHVDRNWILQNNITVEISAV